MAINITAAGTQGTHTFTKVNVNLDEDYIYYTGLTPETEIPSTLINDATFIYSDAVGQLTGVTDDSLVYIVRDNDNFFKLSTTSGGTAIDITDVVAGSVTLNKPVVYDYQLNMDASTPTNQAVKYYTNGDPLVGLTSGETYFLKNVTAAFVGQQALYSFTSHTFTTCGRTGREGPTLSEMQAAYTTDWDNIYLSQGTFQGYQDWTVPVSGIYEFDVRGAAGYEGSGSGTTGYGARVRGRVSLTKGEIITIAVGQRGTAPSSGTVWGGSGGGTFVVRKAGDEPLFVAGGGAADANATAGRNGVLTEDGGFSGSGREGGTDGNGGSSANGYSAGGGGFFSRGQNGRFGEGGGGSFLDGLVSTADSRIGGDGGFGGGGSAEGNFRGQSGGGGGYSGGAGARTTTGSTVGGGGGSYITPTATNVATSDGTYDTVSTFYGSAITNLASYNNGEGSVGVSLISSFTTGNEIYPTAADADAGTNRIDIEPAGSSFHSFVPINYDSANDRIYSTSTHGLSTGDAVTVNFNNGAPLGISNGTIYYIQKVDNWTYQLSSTPGPSYTTINLTLPAERETTTSSTLSKVVVNTSTDTLTITAHGFLVDQPLRYSAGEDGTPILPLQEGATYYIAEVLNANQVRLKVSLDAPTYINFTSAGTGNNHSFIFLTVNAAEDTLYIPNHGLVSGQSIRYDIGTAGNVAIPGLVDDNTYYIVKVDNSIVKLATNSALTQIANISDIDPWPATGTHSLVVTSLDFVNDILTLPGHGFLQGELVQYDSRGQQVVDGLTTATPYYVIFIDGDNIKLATTPQNAEDGVAVDITDSPPGVGRHTLQSLSKTPDGIYEILNVPSPTTFTVQAQGNVPVIEKIFNPRSSIDLNLNAFFIPSHGFLTGTRVTYSQGDAATDIAGLTNNTDYYVVVVNRDYIRLAASSVDAESGTVLTVTDYGTGVGHSFTSSQINGNVTGGGSVTVAQGSVLVNGSGTSFSKVLKVGDTFRLYPPNNTQVFTFANTAVNTTTDRITGTHGFSTGDTVKFDTGGGVAPSPLVNGYYYFVREVSSTEISLHASAADAQANVGNIDFSTQGTGSNFSLTRTQTVSPIIRKVTAVGSDTQITVDRPYASGYNAVSYSFPTFIYVRPQGYALHRPFDGGVEMSVGAGTSLGMIIRQTRKYFRYQSGKGIQTSCGINFKPSIDIETMDQFSATTIECRTRRPHGLISGLFVVISQAEDSYGDPSTVYNGDFQVTVVDLNTFRITANNPIVEPRAYGFPQFFVREWQNGAVRQGMFDFQNGMFYEFDGQEIYCVRRSSTQQMAGTVSALTGSELIFGEGTSFQAQLDVGDYVVLRGQSYRVIQIDSDTRMSVRPEYKGSSGTEKEFNPQTAVNTSTDTFTLVGHGFTNDLPVVYNSIDGEPIGGLINGRTYYVDTNSISAGLRNNNFKLKASPDSVSNVSLSSTGTTTLHSFVPAKSGIIVTKTVDTRVPQADWSIDPCDGSGPTGYNLDLSRIQMAYIDYSWYGAGKIRFGFKTTDGQVQYTHEFVHNNNLYESYFRSGNLPARYEVVTYNNPTYIPYLFHWGTSVMMDGTFDDDNAYLFTAGSQNLNVAGTTPKSFSSSGIDLNTDLVTVLTHGFRTGDILQFQSLAANGLPGDNAQNPGVNAVGNQVESNLTNAAKYKAFVNSENLIHLTPEDATITVGGTFSRSGSTVTVVTPQAHNIPSASNNVGIYFIQDGSGNPIANLPSFYVGPVTVTNATTFTFTVTGSQTVGSTVVSSAAIAEVLDFTSQGNIQYTYFFYPDGALNNTSGPNYQPLISLRLSPSVSEGLTGALGDRDVINRMQLRLKEIGVSSNELVDVKLLLNPRLNNLNFVGVDSPALTQVVEHTAADTVSGGVQVYNFRASGGNVETTVDVNELFELSNSIIGGDSIFPDGPDIITVAVSRLTGNETRTSAKISWSEAQA